MCKKQEVNTIPNELDIEREELEKALLFNERLLKKTEKRTKRLERHAADLRSKVAELEQKVEQEQKKYKELQISYAILEEEKKRVKKIVDDIGDNIQQCPWCHHYFIDGEAYRNHLMPCKKKHAPPPPKRSHDRKIYAERSSYSSDHHS